MTVPPDDTTTDPQSIIAALQQRLDAALAHRNSEYNERIEHQTATIDVLKAISASPGDAQPVFELIATRARDICGSYGVSVFEFDGSLIHLRAWTGVSDNPKVREAYLARFPCAPTRNSPEGRAIVDRHVVYIKDYLSEPDLEHTPGTTIRSSVTVPMIRGSGVIGILDMGSHEVAGFSDTQVQLLKTFAEQAVIAITSAETYRALQTRTSDLQETLEYQTATSDVLKVISGSEFGLAPVFQAIVETAARLCSADQATIYRYQDGEYQWAAGTSLLPDYERIERGVRHRPGTGSLVGRVTLEGRTVQISDAWTDPLYELKDDARVGGVRTMLGVPLLRDGEPIGVIGLARRQVEPFTDRQIELVSTFADQAVIAIENTRLLTEQREALEQQTATAEVLQVINANSGNLTPVFEAMLEKAMRLCDAVFGQLHTFDGDRWHTAAMNGLPAEYAEYRERTPPTYGPGTGPALILQGEDVVHIADIADSEAYRAGEPARRALVDSDTREATSRSRFAKIESCSVSLRSSVRRCDRSPKGKSRCCRTLPTRRSLQSRIRG